MATLARELAEIEESGTYTNFGPKNALLEARLTERVFGGRGGCVTCVNATTGLMLAIRHEMRTGRRYALLPSFTFPASAHAAIWNGLTPLFCDIDQETWLADEGSETILLDAHRDEIAVVVPQATFGNCVDLDRYAALSRFYDVPVVVDAAPAIGSQSTDGLQFGAGSTFPIVFSMHATKAFATDEGGIIHSGREELVAALRSMTNFGFGSPRVSTMPGLNGKLTELGALLALVKLDEIEAVLEAREQLVVAYRGELGGLRFQQPQGVRQAHQFVPVHVRGLDRAGRDELVARIDEQGIEVATYFSPHLAEHPYFQANSVAGQLRVTQVIADGIVSLPMHDGMSTHDVRRVAMAVQSARASLSTSISMAASDPPVE
jgi:dTDP-4-amino-4,6-dideoxygalactose transaminase